MCFKTGPGFSGIPAGIPVNAQAVLFFSCDRRFVPVHPGHLRVSDYAVLSCSYLRLRMIFSTGDGGHMSAEKKDIIRDPAHCRMFITGKNNT